MNGNQINQNHGHNQQPNKNNDVVYNWNNQNPTHKNYYDNINGANLNPNGNSYQQTNDGAYGQLPQNSPPHQSQANNGNINQNNLNNPNNLKNPNNQNNQINNALQMAQLNKGMMMNQMRANQDNTDDNFKVADFSDKKLRLGFIKKTFAILALQLLVTFLITLIPLISLDFREKLMVSIDFH